MSEYVVDGKVFATKKSLQDKVRSILYCYDDNDTVSDTDFSFLRSLLNRHQDSDIKVGVGVQSMFVRRNPKYPSTRGFWIKRIDGSETDFSYLMCLTPETQRQRVRAACRVEIEPVTMAFKERFFSGAGPFVCPITGDPIQYVGSHVDHAPPNTFDCIFRSFILNFHVDVDQIELGGQTEDGHISVYLKCPEFRDEWVKFHNSAASLRVVSARANLSAMRKDSEDGQRP